MAALLRQFLQQRCTSYAESKRRSSITPDPRTADVSGRHCAKLVMYFVDDHLIEAMLPASLDMNLNRLLALAGGREIRAATADEVRVRSRDRDAAESELVHGQRVFVDVSLVSATEIAIILDDDAEPARLGWEDLARTVRPIVGKFAEPQLLWARCRLSPSE